MHKPHCLSGLSTCVALLRQNKLAIATVSRAGLAERVGRTAAHVRLLPFTLWTMKPPKT
ncbi:hypothetical protein P3T22_005850 [Paraburkholderia sp. GAS348]